MVGRGIFCVIFQGRCVAATTSTVCSEEERVTTHLYIVGWQPERMV